MPAKTKTFDDGSRIIWKDRETLQYEKEGQIALIWVDYEPGLFRKGRVVRLESLRNWQGTEEKISIEQQNDIVTKVKSYLGSTGVRVSD